MITALIIDGAAAGKIYNRAEVDDITLLSVNKPAPPTSKDPSKYVSFTRHLYRPISPDPTPQGARELFPNLPYFYVYAGEVEDF